MAHIKTYARLKPSKKPYEGFTSSNKVLTINVPDSKDSTIPLPPTVNRGSMTYDIRFDNIFLPDATQEDVFNNVAKDIIQNFLTGYNGTIFAYGQTGTGKTYTVEGNSCRYETRGLATRALAFIYQELEKRKEEEISVYISYLEIYQEVAYDLLNPAARTMLPVLPFAKVAVVEGPSGKCILRGLSLHLAANEDVAQMLLLQGQANRRVAETPVNQRSSRSHGVFSVYLQARKNDSQVVLNSKLHLVDLAGSERVSKTGVDGQQLNEAKSINLSLHHLETVIIVLQDCAIQEEQLQNKKEEGNLQNTRSSNSFASNPSSSDSCSQRARQSRRHIPYRNSLLTMILKDSLGGNCLTAMIATISLEPENLGESISTCRFAQRVARISNFARRNEQIDDKMLIKKLKMKVAQLETQVALLMSKSDKKSIEGVVECEIPPRSATPENVDCEQILENFLQGVINDPVAAGISNQIRFRQFLQMMKSRLLHQATTTTTLPSFKDPVKSPSVKSSKSADQIINTTCELVEAATPFQEEEKEDKIVYDPATFEAPWTFYKDKKYEEEPNNILLTPFSILDIAEHSPKRVPQHQDNILVNQEAGETILCNEAFEASPSGKTPSVELNGIEKLLMRTGSPPKAVNYKTPFERKREKEIKRLGKKLFSIEEEKLIQEKELELMKQDTILESLRMDEDGLRLKLQVANDQVADQHAYILHLKDIEADAELIAQEMLVEKQLKKRQHKFQSKLEDVRERRIGVERDLLQLDSVIEKPLEDKRSNRSFEDMYGQFKQNKGSLNTRQVFEMLKNEEKRQKKEVGKVEREKTVLKTKQLELKEIATLEKLRELKQMLKMSQRQEVEVADIQDLENEGKSLSVNSQFISQNTPPQEEEKSPEFSISSAPVVLGRNQMPETVSKSTLSESKISPSLSSEAGDYSYRSCIENFIESQCVSNKEAESNQRKNESAPLFHTPLTKPPALFPTSLSQLLLTSPSLDPLPSEKFDRLDSPLSESILPRNSLQMIYQNTSSSNLSMNHRMSMEADENNNTKPNHVGDMCLDITDLENNVDKDMRIALSSSPCGTTTTPHFAPNHHITSGNSRSSPGSSGQSNNLDGNVLKMLSPSAILHTSGKGKLGGSDSKNGRMLPPSEYINSMSEKERFDASRMGLSSRTFESALSHMLHESGDLGNNVPDLPYSVDPYAKYTRKASSPPYRPTYKQPSQRKTAASQSTGNLVKKKKVYEEQSTWGPNTKNVSIADRLNGLFDRAPTESPSAKQRLNEGFAWEEASPARVESFEQPVSLEPGMDRVIVDDSCNEDDSFFGQQTPRAAIKALGKEEGERTFMSRVASEKERIAKIRKARQAAELIQKHWRMFKYKE